MPKVYIINTNKAHNPECEGDMLRNEKCAAYYNPWKYYIDTIEANDLVFLYSSSIGIIARGVATGIVEIADYEGVENAEHYIHLNRFDRLTKPLKAADITAIIREAAGDDFDIKWAQTMILMAYPFGMKVWQHITRHCL